MKKDFEEKAGVVRAEYGIEGLKGDRDADITDKSQITRAAERS